jgi:hypothetical protein
MHYLGPIAVIVAALVALSGLIISKKPELKATFDKITPYQGFLGVGLLAVGVYDLIWFMGSHGAPKSYFGLILEWDKLAGISAIGYVISEILLGFMLGFGLIATWIPGESGAEKGAVKVQKKLLALSVPIGIAGLVFAILWLVKHPPIF